MTFITDTPTLHVMMNGLDSMARTTMYAAYFEALDVHSVVVDRRSSRSPGGGGGGHSHICPVQICAAVKTPPPFFDLTRA